MLHSWSARSALPQSRSSSARLIAAWAFCGHSLSARPRSRRASSTGAISDARPAAIGKPSATARSICASARQLCAADETIRPLSVATVVRTMRSRSRAAAGSSPASEQSCASK